MGSLPSEGLDESHCLRALCPHPCCWDTEQRIARGIARYTKSQTYRGRAPVEVEEFPTLSVVNVSEWAEGKKPAQVKLLYKTLSREDGAANTLLTPLTSQPQSQKRESADIHCPEINSVVQSPHDSKQKKVVKPLTAQIKPLASGSSGSRSSNSLVVWIPNPLYTPQCHAQTRPHSPLVAVKELVCLPSSQSYKSDIMNRKKHAQKNVQFQLTPLMPQQGNEEGLGSPVSEGAVDPADPDPAQPDTGRNRQGVDASPEAQALASPRPPAARRVPSAFLLRNRPIVFHSVRERILKRHTQQDPSVSKYKLDTETEVDNINWEKLRRQTYLWRKHKLPASRDKEKPASPQENITVSQLGPPWGSLGISPVPKATLHYHSSSPLSIGPAVWQCVDCVKGKWPSQRYVLPSKSKCHHSRLSNSSHMLCNGSDLCLNPMHQLLCRDDISDVDMSSNGAIAPYNSMLHLHDPALQERCHPGELGSTLCLPPGSEGESPGAQEETASNPEDRGPGAPPPARLNSDTCGDDRHFQGPRPAVLHRIPQMDSSSL